MVKVMENLSKMDDLGKKKPLFLVQHPYSEVLLCPKVSALHPLSVSDRRWSNDVSVGPKKSLRPGELERHNDEDPLESGL